jgi:large subunit ribosomal protein L29
MKAKDLRERTQDDLRDLEKSLAKDVFQARFKNFTNRLDDTSTIGKTRRDLARVKTLLRQQELNAAVKAEGGEAAAATPKAARENGKKKAAAKKKASAKAAGAAPTKKKSTKTKAASEAKS